MKRILVALSALIALSACSINHPVADDYHQYLSDHNQERKLPKADVGAKYATTEATQNSRHEIRSMAAGMGNHWTVEFKKMLDATLQAPYVVEAIGAIREEKNIAQADVVFDLVDYHFSNFAAHITLKISTFKNGQVEFSRTYNADGIAQTGKVMGGGFWAMKHAIHQSTKSAMDTILTNFLIDYTAKGR